MHSTPVPCTAFGGRWMVLISWERWQLLRLQGGANQKAGKALQSTMAGSGMLFIPAAPVTETLLPLGSELWIPPFAPVCSTNSR